MRRFLLRRGTERVHMHALKVHGVPNDVADDAAFACSVHTLQYEQH